MPSLAFASSIPAFPMSFWGNVTINGNQAPVGTIVRAYYGTDLAGQVTVQDAGVYGYTDSTKQKLVVGEATGTISFTVQSPAYNSGAETAGSAAITYQGFTSGATVNLNLSFTVPTPTSSSTGGGGPAPAPVTTSSGGNNSGGVISGSIASSTTAIIPVASTTPVSTTTVAVPIGEVLGAQTFSFTRDLHVGSSGNDVTELQKILIGEGDDIPAITSGATPYGYFGAQTKTAVIKYQKAHGITPASGYVGRLTRAVLNGGTIPQGVETTTATSSTLTDAQRTALIQSLEAQLKVLMAEIDAMISGTASSTTQ